MRVPILCAVLLIAGCDSADGAVEKAKDATKVAQDAADKTVKGTKDAVDASKKAVDDVKALWDEVPTTGELSDKAKSWVGADEGSMAKVIATGEQVAPVALEIGKVLSDAVDSDRMIEPIYQNVGEGKAAEVDAAIKAMPRTEVIEGLTIGFKQLDETSSDKLVKERGYLVTWREGDHLVGFIYRTKRTIDVDKLVAETPRLVQLTRSALAAGD